MAVVGVVVMAMEGDGGSGEVMAMEGLMAVRRG